MLMLHSNASEDVTHRATSGSFFPPLLLFSSHDSSLPLSPQALVEDLKVGLVTMVHRCMERDYLAATDKYIKLAIGNAPWPIGVTMVGIHERSAREKIHTQSVAHVMNDETTRKYLQSVKRLMTL